MHYLADLLRAPWMILVTLWCPLRCKLYYATISYWWVGPSSRRVLRRAAAMLG